MWPFDCVKKQRKSNQSCPVPPTPQKKKQTKTKQQQTHTNLVFVSLFLFGVTRNLIVSEWVFTTLSAGLLAMLKGPC